MINVRFYRKTDGSIHMEMKGHAGAAPKGEDLICASATMLAYTVAQAVQELYDQQKLKKKPKIHIEEGEATVIATPTESGYGETLHTFQVAQTGIHVLAHNYPANVKLEQFSM